MSIGKCALCGSNSELRESHIIPKLGIKKLKKTSVGKLRRFDNPNVTIQDSEKQYLLCSKCEELFSTYETAFASNIFHPYLDKNKTEFFYDDKISKFILSVSWRNLYLDIIDWVKNGEISIESLEILIENEKLMREYLLGQTNDLRKIKDIILNQKDNNKS
jgi:hypothetical protein